MCLIKIVLIFIFFYLCKNYIYIYIYVDVNLWRNGMVYLIWNIIIIKIWYIYKKSFVVNIVSLMNNLLIKIYGYLN